MRILALALLGGCSQIFGLSDPAMVDAPRDTTPPDAPTGAMCSRHTDCASALCLPNGHCANELDVAYVDPLAPAANQDCTQAAPCSTIAAALVTGRLNVKLHGTIVEPIAISGRDVKLFADPGTRLGRSTVGIVITIGSGSSVELHDALVVGNGDRGISVNNGLLRVDHGEIVGCNAPDRPALESKAGTLILTRSQIHDNAGGGILLDSLSAFDITNTFIHHNGMDNTRTGGVVLQPTAAGQNRFDLNTVVDNHAKLGAVGGVNCSASGLAPADNIIARNYANGATTSPDANVLAFAGCDFSGSLVTTDVTPIAFVNADGPAPQDYHLTAGSSALDRAQATSITDDFDGEPRPSGAGVDFGADELQGP